MSYQHQSPPPQQQQTNPPPRPCAPPYQTSGSPLNPSPYAPPPAKRQRLSPVNGHNPYPPPYQYSNLGAYGNPYAQSPLPLSPYGSPQSSFHTPQPYPAQQLPWHSQPSTPAPAVGGHGSPTNSQTQSSQMMPPPPRPNKEEREDRINAEDIGDSLFASGINLKDEENYMHSTFNNRHGGYESFNSNQSTSFGSSTLSPNNSFSLLTQSMGSQGKSNGAFSGTMGQALSQADLEAQIRRKRERAAFVQNEHLQQPLHNQFLLANCVRRRLDQSAYDSGVKLPTTGLYVRNSEHESSTLTNGEPKTRPESMVERGSDFDHLLSLVSLAASQRLRGLLDEAFALSRARRYGDHGRVPPEFADIAEGEGKRSTEEVVPESITNTQWDKVPVTDGHTIDGVNRQFASSTPQPQQTVSFQGKLNSHLRKIAEVEKQVEKERVKKREARRRAAEAENGEDASGDPVTDMTAEPIPSKTSLKKEEAKAKKEKNEVSNQQVNATISHAIGGKKKRYAWMTDAGSELTKNKYKSTPGSEAVSGIATPTKATGAPGFAGSPAAASSAVSGAVGAVATMEVKAPEWGDWREDGGVQARDLALVLERDGREKKALQRVLNRLT